MKVFISWSKEPSKSIAEELRHTLSAFVPGCQPWMSDHDLQPGQQWNSQLTAELSDCKIALVCVTAQNGFEPWLNFEAGAISNALGGAFVHPILFEIDSQKIPSTLSQFQVTKFDVKRFFLLLRSLNRLLPHPEAEHDLRERFDRLWPAFESAIQGHLTNYSVPVEEKTLKEDLSGPERKQKSLLDELNPESHLLLKTVTQYPGSDLGRLASLTKLHPVRVEHYVDKLLEKELIEASYNYMDSTSYNLAEIGRAIAVAENWV